MHVDRIKDGKSGFKEDLFLMGKKMNLRDKVILLLTLRTMDFSSIKRFSVQFLLEELEAVGPESQVLEV